MLTARADCGDVSARDCINTDCMKILVTRGYRNFCSRCDDGVMVSSICSVDTVTADELTPQQCQYGDL